MTEPNAANKTPTTSAPLHVASSAISSNQSSPDGNILPNGNSSLSKVPSESHAHDLKQPTNEAPPTGSVDKPKRSVKNRLSPLSLRSFRSNSVPSIVVSDTESIDRTSPKSDRKWGDIPRSFRRRRKSGESCRKPSLSPPARAPLSETSESCNASPRDVPPSTLGLERSPKPSHHTQNSEENRDAVAGDVSQEESTRGRVGSSFKARRREESRSLRALSVDEDMLSRRVRLMYEKGGGDVSDAELARVMALETCDEKEVSLVNVDADAIGGDAETKSAVSSLAKESIIQPPVTRDSHELAGGIEDWQDIGAGDVDRYGFIRPKTSPTSERPQLQRVSTSLLLATQTPRRKRSIKPLTGIGGEMSLAQKDPDTAMRPSSSQSGYKQPLRRRGTSRFRHATNHLPHNRNRKFKDEAGDMLTLPVDIINDGDAQDTPTTRSMRRKEWQREEKWTKMAKPTGNNKTGGGTSFEFDTRSSKLVDRTWKGIPDRWRSTAWYSFLEASAKQREGSPRKEELILIYHEYQSLSSADDVQIDIDVPRTISSHIMFRRRYRGGQRLLFRVLHASSLYFPDIGYVQGMAALAATLLAYYDEEHAFVMLVRLFQLRGLDKLYKAGFAGLMEALDDFEKEWVGKGEVAGKLVSKREF